MSRVQLALNVSDLEGSIAFYTRLFGTEPHKLRPGYANFEIVEPPLKLVLIEASADARGTGTAGALNHLGIEVEDTAAVTDALARMQNQGVDVVEEMDTNCCYAQQDKVWVHDPAGAPWEIYTITDDTPLETPTLSAAQAPTGQACECGPAGCGPTDIQVESVSHA